MGDTPAAFATDCSVGRGDASASRADAVSRAVTAILRMLLYRYSRRWPRRALDQAIIQGGAAR
jgi:hypothetical protein